MARPTTTLLTIFRPPRAVTATLGVCVLIAMMLFAVQVVGLHLNVTDSMPVGVYRVTRLAGLPRVGEVLWICETDGWGRFALLRGYVNTGSCMDGSYPLVKWVAGVPGDHIEVAGSGVSVNGVHLALSAPRLTDARNRPMPRLRGSFVVPPGTVWLYSQHPHGFDSRYFGPVPISLIVGVAEPVLIQGSISWTSISKNTTTMR